MAMNGFIKPLSESKCHMSVKTYEFMRGAHVSWNVLPFSLIFYSYADSFADNNSSIRKNPYHWLKFVDASKFGNVYGVAINVRPNEHNCDGV